MLVFKQLFTFFKVRSSIGSLVVHCLQGEAVDQVLLVEARSADVIVKGLGHHRDVLEQAALVVDLHIAEGLESI
jgi:hypothetical protein